MAQIQRAIIPENQFVSIEQSMKQKTWSCHNLSKTSTLIDTLLDHFLLRFEKEGRGKRINLVQQNQKKVLRYGLPFYFSFSQVYTKRSNKYLGAEKALIRCKQQNINSITDTNPI